MKLTILFPLLASGAGLMFSQEGLAALSATISIPGTSDSSKEYQSCDSFRGAIENHTVWLKPEASGGSGIYDYTLIWRFNSGYRDYGVESQFERHVKLGRTFGMFIPELRDDIPYVQQSVLLIAKDRVTGETVNAESLFTVSRNVILTPSRDPKVQDQDCFERYPAVQSNIGVLTNGSTNLSSLTIKQGIDRLWGSTTGTSWGYYFSPLSLVSIYGVSLANLFTINRNYFSMVSKQTSETVEVNTEYQLSPGDQVQVYTQKTRFISHYDAITVDGCGNRKIASGAYPMQWWGFAYHAVPINPFDPARPNPDTIGARPVNTCSAALTPDSGNREYQFMQTNL